MTSQTLNQTSGRLAWLGLPRGLRAGVRAIVALRVERATRRKLDAMSDHLLRDIGVRRNEIADVSKASAGRLASEMKLRTMLFL